MLLSLVSQTVFAASAIYKTYPVKVVDMALGTTALAHTCWLAPAVSIGIVAVVSRLSSAVKVELTER